MHQFACIYIVVPQQTWTNTYLEVTFKIEEDMFETSVFKLRSWLQLKSANKN